jgi:hypothetical protein
MRLSLLEISADLSLPSFGRFVQARVLFYVLHVAANDEMTQRHGFVILYNAKVRERAW